VAEVLVPAGRFVRWVANFEDSHGPSTLKVDSGALDGRAVDGSRFTARLAFGTTYEGEPIASPFANAAVVPEDWGVLLVRKGGFAIARLSGPSLTASKVGQRHVQGRTKAGGQSQQRFARRRSNQARQAYQAASDHATRLLAGLGPIVSGGDRVAVREVLADPRLDALRPVELWLPVPDPRRAVLERAIADAQSLRVEVTNF